MFSAGPSRKSDLKRRWLRLIAGTVLVGLGLCATPLHAQSTGGRSAYYVAEFDLRDPEGIKPYSAGVAATFAPFGGRFIVRGGRLIGLEGPTPGSRTVIIEFPSIEQAQAWYDSEAYRDLRPFRQRSGISRTYIIEGLGG